VSSNAARATVLVLAIAAAVALFVALSGEDDEASSPTTTAATIAQEPGGDGAEKPKPEPKVPVIEIKDGRPVGGVRELTFDAGEEIRFDVASDAPAHVHLHGYDVFRDVPAGGRTGFAVSADIEGVFEVEIETTATQLAEIIVEP
jgi:hypothetical protein